ncbi:hypothetical protein FKP32DRAFT_1648884 [Trametes sanguinea]|nr:hypothetical protein FKP32DRAFT_1648884 [Trametes sanguinea]
MPPLSTHRLVTTRPSISDIQHYFSSERLSWLSPDDTLSILLILGGDIVQRGVAQLAGSGPGLFAPVAFSFGWVAYSISAVTSAFGDGRLMPQPERTSYVVNAKTGYKRENASWVLGRLLRDYEDCMAGESERVSLTIAFYNAISANGDAGGTNPARRTPDRDMVYWIGIIVILVQFGISIIPGALHGDWIVFIWTDEKFAARTLKANHRDIVCLTRGNGAPFVMVVISEGAGLLRLEDLASGRVKHRQSTSMMSVILCILWIVLLLTVEGLDGDAWYLLAVGGLGMAQNIFAAGTKRDAGAFGLHLREEDRIKEPTAMKTLQKAEEKETGVGQALLKVFFPGELREDEKRYWNALRAPWEPERSQERPVLPPGSSSSTLAVMQEVGSTRSATTRIAQSVTSTVAFNGTLAASRPGPT